MFIRTNRETLMPVLNKVGGVVERRQTLPILGNFLFSANDEGVAIVATDLEVEVRARFPATVEGGGDATLPARKFIDICRALPEGADVSIKVDGARAVIVAGRSRFTLSTLPATDYPAMEGGAGDESLELTQGLFRRILDKTSFAMAHQDVRYYLNGLFLRIGRDGVMAVATDGHRMAKVGEDVSLDIEEPVEIILPRKTVGELQRLLSASDDPLRLDVSEKSIRAYLGGESVVNSKLVDGRYPEFERVIPLMANRVATLDRDSLKESLQRTSILSNEKFKGVRFQFENGLLRLQAHNPEQEEAEEELEIEYQDEPTAIGFNVGYLLDVLNVLEAPEVEMRFTNSNSSALLRNRGRENETYVVMPMRL
jgi:DNA polymerase-3 subunit beta